VARCRRLLDLDADPESVDGRLAADPALAEAVRKEPGIRVPRTVDGFELALRAVIGQQVSVAGARATLGKLVAALSPDVSGGIPETGASGVASSADAPVPGREATLPGLRSFPSAAQVAGAPDAAFGMPAARRRTVRAIAEAVASGQLHLDGGADRADTEAALLALPGVGPWTANLIIMRALSDPDIFLPTDLGVRRGAAALGLPDDPVHLDEHARRWRPWRSYAVLRLWRQHS
jgi:AraC family transcriptional regulator of adaptative response / DNA-3-methyladenine glycosylase II